MSGRGKLRILYLMDALEGGRQTGGTEAQVLELLRHLDRDRFEPHLGVFRPTMFVNDAGNLPCPVTIFGIGKLLHPRALLQLIRLSSFVRRERFDVVHILLNDAALVGPLFCRLGGARVVASRRDMGFWYTRAHLAALRLSNTCVTQMIANSDAVKRNVHQREAYPLARITTVRNGHDPRRFAVAPLPELRARLGLAPDDPIVGMVANLNPWKRHLDLIRAFADVRRVHPRAALLLVGAGPSEDSIRDEVRRLDLLGAVRFLGAVTDAVPIVRHFDVGVLCSESEGLSNALIEYMACGVPSVSTDVGGNPELLTDGESGFLVSPGDVGAIADRLIRLLNRPAERRRMAAAARRAAEALTSARMARAHMDVYSRAASPGGAAVVSQPVGERA